MSEEISQALAKLRRKQESINAFHRTFATKEGKLALSLLKAAFKTDQPAFLNVGKDGVISFDTHYAAKRDGQRDVILQIEAFLAQPLEADGNIQESKVKPNIRK